MAKRYGRPSAQYRYEHYDPEIWTQQACLTTAAWPRPL